MTDSRPHPGSLFVVAAPSGAGKTSLVRALLADAPLMQLSVSFTTRAPRPGEVEGHDYFFVDQAGFEQRRAAGEFLEWAEVHGNLYATSRTWIEGRIDVGVDIVLEIDWQGATQVQRLFPDAIGIFIVPPSVGVLRERLTQRGQDSAEIIEQRVAAAQAELRQAHRFQYVIINQDFASALGDLRMIVQTARLRFAKQQARHPATFAALGITKRKQV
ncbi:MAG: guanylate kinase [Burkholderiaceae bacterium]|jgi:guanylate kinase|nr:guanylate kinase [Burkholderiaceae bacterium]MEB2350910.1 guanylate kinase [Burkholderiaceae bacterium]